MRLLGLENGVVKIGETCIECFALGPALCSHARELIFPSIHEVSTVADNTLPYK